MYPLAVTTRLDLDLDGIAAALDAVLEGVLQQRLQQQGGNGACERGAVDVPGQRDPIGKALLHDLRVQLQHADFLAQRRDLLVAPLQRRAQQIGQARQQPIGPRHVDLHQRRDRIQGIEEEMRAQLRLELGELRFGQRLLQRQQALALLLRLGERVEAEDESQPQAEEHDQLDRFVDQHVRPGFVRVRLAEQRIDAMANRVDGRDERNDDQRQPFDVMAEPAQRLIEIDGIAPVGATLQHDPECRHQQRTAFPQHRAATGAVPP